MTSQPDLWSAAPHVRHSQTSRLAALEVAPKAETLRARVLDLLRNCGPLSDEQIAARLGIDGNTARPRRRELQQAGLVVEAGETLTVRGRRAVKWGAA